MINFYFKIVLLFSLIFSFKLSCQQKIYSKQEIGKFKKNEKFYLNKKVKDVLKDLKVNFETAFFGGGWIEETSFISLRFNKVKDYNQLQARGLKPAKMTIFIKEQDTETNKLFFSDPRKVIYRDSLKNQSNKRILKAYKNLTVLMIYANSEEAKTKEE
jgi:hypothetical protein